MKKKFLFLLICMILNILPNTNADDDIKIIANGKPVEFYDNQKPFIENGTTLIPVRKIFELLDAEVSWDQNTSTARATKLDKVVEIQNDSRYIRINGKISEMPVKAQARDGYMFVPLRIVSEAFGTNINWDGNTKVVSIEDYSTKSFNEQSFPVENIVFKKVAEQVDTVVAIDVLDSNYKVLYSCSGVIISEDGYIATNLNADYSLEQNFRVTFINNKTLYNDKVYFNYEKDLMVLKINKNNFKAAKTNKDAKIKIADPVVLVSNPLEYKNTLCDGLVSGFVNYKEVEYIQATASIASFSSGGGLFDLEGNLVGIEKIGVGGDYNLFIKIEDILEFINSKRK